ncbi:hypothetical protein [Nocardioides caricicola]|uniref:Uncharacterized protein n=1 Tax=Nocardioides caricicola TaxID=634770 RepID=A0ABW0N6G8_9ACTN
MSDFDPSGEGIELLGPLRARAVAPWQEWWLGCDEGWWPILARLAGDLSEIAPAWSLQTAKQKFAELRLYVNPGTDDADVVRRFKARIENAEREAARTCERCGASGITRRSDSGYLQVRCRDCATSDSSHKWLAVGGLLVEDGSISRLPDRPTGYWRVTTEHGTTWWFLFDAEQSGWMRVEASVEDRPAGSGEPVGRWRTLRSGPCLSEWHDGASRPEPVGDADGFPVPGLAVGQGFWIGESMFSDHWWSTNVVSIERLGRDDLPADVRVRLTEWQRRRARADEDG